MSALAFDLDETPPLPGAALPWMVGGLLVLWLALRVWVLRSQLEHRAPEEGPPRAWPPLLALARSPLALAALALLLAGCIAGAALSWR